MSAPAVVETEPTRADLLAELQELAASLVRLLGTLTGAVA